MRRRQRRTLGRVLLLVLLTALAFVLPYLWTLLTSDPPIHKDPKADDYARD